MSDFDTLCNKLETMDPEQFAQLFNDLSVDVMGQLLTITEDGPATLDAYLQFLVASIAADGVFTKEEFMLLKPIMDKSVGKDVTYEEGLQIFKQMGLDDPVAMKEVVDLLVDVIGEVSEDLKDKIVMLCLLVCAIDGDVSEKEKDWIRQLVAPIDAGKDSMDIINQYLDKAGVFTLATTCRDQPRMRVLGLKIVLDGKIYFAVGTFKDVYKQLMANPKCEIMASLGEEFMRWDGKAVFVDDPRLMPIVENMMPELAQMYKEMGWKLGFFTLEGGSAEVVDVSNVKKKIF